MGPESASGIAKTMVRKILNTGSNNHRNIKKYWDESTGMDTGKMHKRAVKEYNGRTTKIR